MPATIARATIVLAVAVTLGACNGSEASPTARRSATRWATEVCTALSGWIDVAANGASRTTAAEAALELRAEISGTEPPDTDDGLAAQGEMEKLATSIERRTRDGSPTEIERTVAEARLAAERIRGLTPGGAVEQALDESAACRAPLG